MYIKIHDKVRLLFVTCTEANILLFSVLFPFHFVLCWRVLLLFLLYWLLLFMYDLHHDLLLKMVHLELVLYSFHLLCLHMCVRIPVVVLAMAMEAMFPEF